MPLKELIKDCMTWAYQDTILAEKQRGSSSYKWSNWDSAFLMGGRTFGQKVVRAWGELGHARNHGRYSVCWSSGTEKGRERWQVCRSHVSKSCESRLSKKDSLTLRGIACNWCWRLLSKGQTWCPWLWTGESAAIGMAPCDKELQIVQVRSKRVVNKDTAGIGSDLKPAWIASIHIHDLV